MPTHKEQTTVIVSVNTELDEGARFEHIQKHVGQGYRVLSAVPLSGGDLGPGGDSQTFERMLVHLEREIDEDNVIVQGAGSALSGDAAVHHATNAAHGRLDEATPAAAADAPRDPREVGPGASDSSAATGDVSGDV